VVRYFNAWVEHITDKKEIEELDFPSSEESMDEIEDSSNSKQQLFAGLSAKKNLKFNSRSRFMS
jgi:hypothetical protein